MQLNIQVTGIKELQASLKGFSDRRLNAAVATALTRTAVQVRNKVKTSMSASLDNPTAYTMRQLMYVSASAKNLVAAVGFNVAPIQDVWGNALRYTDLGPGQTPAGKYLDPQITGGRRRNKRFELALRARGLLPAGWFAVPGERAKVDQFGNQSVGEIKQILSWFAAAEPYSGSTQNMTAATKAKRIKGTKRTAGFQYFVMPVGGKRAGPRQPGIYRKTSFALGTRLEPIMIFVKSSTYKKRFDFNRIAQDEANRVMPTEVQRAVQESAARLAAKV
jgi:hypothetical protein